MSIYSKATAKSSANLAIYKGPVSDDHPTPTRYTVRATDPDGFSSDSSYDNLTTAQVEINLLADYQAKYWLGFRFDLYDNFTPGYPPIWSKSVEAPTSAPAPALVEVEPVEATVFCSNCKTYYATGPDGLCNSCRPDQGYTETISAIDHAEVFGF